MEKKKKARMESPSHFCMEEFPSALDSNVLGQRKRLVSCFGLFWHRLGFILFELDPDKRARGYKKADFGSFIAFV